jgi:predicted transcriptional regulator of viral defense system
MKITRLKIAKDDIVKHFGSLPNRVYKRSQIEEIISEKREFWRLSSTTTANKFIAFLIEEKKLREIRLEFPKRTEIRYTWGDVSIYEMALTLKPDSYFTHYTAMFFHELTEQIPKTIYLNQEQPKKPKQETHLTQSSIDLAFKRPVRVSNNIALCGEYNICLLNGMHTGRLGVIETMGSGGEKIHVTDIERTLIDLTVRPTYSGGIFEVLNAYRLARNKISVNKLSAILQKLNYIYPYHQAVGFYLDRAGNYEDSSISLFRKFGMKYDFYLTHQMKDMVYSKEWKLFYPKGL